MNFVGIIPARYGSTGIPGKPLVLVGGKPMIQRVYEQSKRVLDKVIVATDDERIVEFMQTIGAEAVMTSKKHKTGTERCAEALDILSAEQEMNCDTLINIPVDHPFIYPEQIESLIHSFQDSSSSIVTMVKPVNNHDDIFDESIVKVVLNKNKEAIYMSHSPVPFIFKLKKQQKDWTKFRFYKHLQIYAYKCDVLKQIAQLEMSYLEESESIEPLRWIENGYKLNVEITEYESAQIKTKRDLQKLNQISLM